MIRINKFLAQCGVASRRGADTLVTEGRITVNGIVVDKPGSQIDETSDEVRLDGDIVAPISQFKYVVLNKPAGYVTSMSDPHHKKTVIDLIKDVDQRVYPVGRLDLDTEGVLLFTNDGEMAHRLSHPKFGIKRIYLAHVKGEISQTTLAKFPKGIKLPDGNIGRAQVAVRGIKGGFSDIVLELKEGRKREVKYLCKAVGHPVVKLKRLEFAGITGDRLKRGQWRYLTDKEIGKLRKLIGL